MSTHIIVDSSCWLEYFTNTDRSPLFAPAVENTECLIVPVVTIYEVYKKVLRCHGHELATLASELMERGRVVDMDASLARNAARNSLPFTDSIIYATALRHGCELWTQDSHFEHLPHVRYFPKKENP